MPEKLSTHTCMHNIIYLFVKWNRINTIYKKCSTLMVYTLDSLFSIRKELSRFSFGLRKNRHDVNRNDNWWSQVYCASLFFFFKLFLKSSCSAGIKPSYVHARQAFGFVYIYIFNRFLSFQGHRAYRQVHSQLSSQRNW